MTNTPLLAFSAIATMTTPNVHSCSSLLQNIRAVGFTENLLTSDPNSIRDFTILAPLPAPRDLVIRVKAVSVNPVDTKERKRKTSPDGKPIISGWDVSGIVEGVGSEVTAFKAGDSVYYAGSIMRPGGNSELHAVDERLVSLKPRNLSFEESASLPLTSLTAYEALFEQLSIKAGQTILIIGGAGGVGSIATQMAKLSGLRVVVTASRVESIEWAKKMGADIIIDHRKPLLTQLNELGLQDVDYIFNTASTSQYWEQMAEIIKPFGKICSIVESDRPLDLTLFMRKSITFSWELMFTKSMYETRDMSEQSQILDRVAKWVEEGKIRPTVNKILNPINSENMRLAHEQLESGKSIGKLVLSGW